MDLDYKQNSRIVPRLSVTHQRVIMNRLNEATSLILSSTSYRLFFTAFLRSLFLTLRLHFPHSATVTSQEWMEYNKKLSVFMADGINNVDLRNVRKIYHFLVEKDQAFKGGVYEGHIDDGFILRLFDNSEENRQSYIKILNLSWSHRFFFYEVKGLEDEDIDFVLGIERQERKKQGIDIPEGPCNSVFD